MVKSGINLEELLGSTPPAPEYTGCSACGSGAAASNCNAKERRPPATAVRFGYMRYLGEFTYALELRFTAGAHLVVQTKRGIEIGQQVPLTCRGCDRAVPRERVTQWVETCGQEAFIYNAGRILREATAADLAENARIQMGNHEKRVVCQRLSDQHNLPLKIVECECPFGGERIIFFFTAEDRVDFRAMVKDLAGEYRTRIEMRQVGARDEARLLADYETCGREVCCKSFLKTLRPVSMKMAKLQKATLDPSKVSGRCGRLKCCLRYEHKTYEELAARLPRSGTRVCTEHEEGVVVGRQVIAQLVQIRTDDNEFITVALEDLVDRVPGSPPVPSATPPPDATRREPQSSPRPRFAKPSRQSRSEVGPRTPQPDRPERTAPVPDRQDQEGEADSKSAPAGEQAESRQTPPKRKRRHRRGRRRGGGAEGSGSGPSGPGPTGGS